MGLPMATAVLPCLMAPLATKDVTTVTLEMTTNTINHSSRLLKRHGFARQMAPGLAQLLFVLDAATKFLLPLASAASPLPTWMPLPRMHAPLDTRAPPRQGHARPMVLGVVQHLRA